MLTVNLIYAFTSIKFVLQMISLNTLRTCKVLKLLQIIDSSIEYKGSEHSQNKSSSSFISNADHLKARLCSYLTVKLVLTHCAGALLRNSPC